MAEGSKYTGLSEAEAARRLRETGPNQVSRGRRVSLARIFAGQFGDYMTLILIGCAGISAVLGEGREALAMLAIVLLNASSAFCRRSAPSARWRPSPGWQPRRRRCCGTVPAGRSPPPRQSPVM